MEKYLYFRVGTATATEDDEATGSNLYPVSHFMGATSGTADANGAVTDDDNAISLYLKPIRRIAGEAEGAAGDGENDTSSEVILRLRMTTGSSDIRDIQFSAFITGVSMNTAVGEVASADISWEANGAPYGSTSLID